LTGRGESGREVRPPDASRRGRDRSGESGNPPRAERRIRLTLDLTREQHRFIRRFALDAETDASSVLRMLLALLEEDSKLADQVLRRLESKYAS
jgi:hypothetical protein